MYKKFATIEIDQVLQKIGWYHDVLKEITQNFHCSDEAEALRILRGSIKEIMNQQGCSEYAAAQCYGYHFHTQREVGELTKKLMEQDGLPRNSARAKAAFLLFGEKDEDDYSPERKAELYKLGELKKYTVVKNYQPDEPRENETLEEYLIRHHAHDSCEELYILEDSPHLARDVTDEALKGGCILSVDRKDDDE